eukprot:CAMPEP_0171159364 /NCGR_PEP_ID=MMETSP0790-20130122/3002_1 /TAXON_ID=2925 /ORGANISM="Alexandrium catenella, Strain OF101" /LENGTH=535 /DNA_ID=CAMNT_0011623861 /DNA_START=178 /DNA_END=1785 /DNA_ORIENTATION=+
MQLSSRSVCTGAGPFGLPPDTLAWAAAAAVALIISAPLDLSQLVFVSLGAAAYYLLQFSPTVPRRPAPRVKTPAASAARHGVSKTACTQPHAVAAPAGPQVAEQAVTNAAAPRPKHPWHVRERKVVRSEAAAAPASAPAACGMVQSISVRPIVTPSFSSVDFDVQVEELLRRIEPTAQTDRLAKEIARSVAEAVRKVLPETEVIGVATGSGVGGTAFGVAVPEVEVVANISPAVLLKRMQVAGVSEPGQLRDPAIAKAEARRLQKVATRICTDRLVGSSHFKFRRSAFRAHEPKVTLLAVGVAGSEGVPFDLSVNCATPLCNAALLEECGQMEPRARALILLVRRWAKDRGICHAAKGHLPPYAWTLLVVYFMQVGVPGEGPLLPPLRDFEKASGLLSGSWRAARAASKVSEWKPPVRCATQMTVGTLFRAFLDFYGAEVDWRREAVAVHRGRRASPELAAELHIVLREDQSVEVAPTIQDPFEPRRNVATSTTAEGLARLRQEFARAQALCTRGAALAELLQPWSPEASASTAV